MSKAIQNRYDFIYLFDVKDGNPNGDPDAGNLPRIDPETGHGLVTDVCLKRKIRNYVGLIKNLTPPFDIYVKEKAVLGRAHVKAFQELNIVLGEEQKISIPKSLQDIFEEISLPEGLSIETNDTSEGNDLLIDADADKKSVLNWIKDDKPDKKVADFIKTALKNSRSRKPLAAEIEMGRIKMCATYFDIRTFGAVLSLKSAPNCGQVRGPIQLTFARSVDQVIPLEHSITRMAVATEAEAEKQQGENRTMGRKFTIPYGLYLSHGFISAALAEQTGFSEDDLGLFWEALKSMFEHDRSAARGQMAAQKLLVFRHDGKLGNSPAHELFNRIKVNKKEIQKPARDFSDYAITIDRVKLPQGIELIEMI